MVGSLRRGLGSLRKGVGIMSMRDDVMREEGETISSYYTDGGSELVCEIG